MAKQKSYMLVGLQKLWCETDDAGKNISGSSDFFFFFLGGGGGGGRGSGL